MSTREPERGILGFFYACISSPGKFRRLVVLIVVLALAAALVVAVAKGELIAAYYQLTPHASEWERWIVPPGGIGVFFGSKAVFDHRRKLRRKRALKAKKAAKKAKKKALPGNRTTLKPKSKKATG